MEGPCEVPAIRDRDDCAGDRAFACAFAAALSLGLCACSLGSPAEPEFEGGLAGDNGSPADAGPTADAAAAGDYCAEAGSRGDGAAFSDLYRDFFGPSGQASCSARSICHVPGGTGAQTSGGYVCAPDEASCWASMTSTIVPEGGSTTPDQTTLYRALRKAPPTPGSGPMPRNSTFAFCPDDLARIRTWIAAGAAGP
jgi:hypothetical protein